MPVLAIIYRPEQCFLYWPRLRD